MNRNSEKLQQGNFERHKWLARRGTLFHYYLIYLFLSSVMLTSAGLCMHTVLKADRFDSEVSAYLKTVLQLERALRRDAELNLASDVQPTTLMFSDVEAGQIRWAVDKNVLRRELRNQDELLATERFVFRKGTDISFSAKDGLIGINLTELPQLTQTSGGLPEASTARPVVEILLFSKPVATSEASESASAKQPSLDAAEAGVDGVSPKAATEDAVTEDAVEERPAVDAEKSGEAS